MTNPFAQRRARWIWRQRPDPPPGMAALFANTRPHSAERNRFIYFRKAFDLASAPQSAMLHISADGRYQLFVNGTLVGRGPARCDPAWQYYDSYDIAPLLHEGANVIAVLGHSYGQHMSWYQLPRHEAARTLGSGGIFVQSDITAGDNMITVDSDASWRYYESQAWQQDTSGGAVGFVEVFDARMEPLGWHEADFDDSDWQAAQVQIASRSAFVPPTEPFPHMVPRDIPFLREEPLRPAILHRTGEVIEANDQPSLPKQIGAEGLRDFDNCRLENAEGLLDGSGEATVTTAPGWGVALVFDFGRVVTGRPRIEVNGPAGTIIDVGCSERLQDGHIEPREHSFLTSENVDRVTTRAGVTRWERFEWTGFRYLQLTVRNADEPLTIKSVDVNFTTYPVENRGSFECSDDVLNRIWQAGAYTLQLCMHDGFEDCPQREQRQFVGDAYIEALINFTAFGDPFLTAKLLRQVAQSQRADGMTAVATPCDFAAEGDTTIPDFAFYWMLTIRQYVRFTGDEAIVDELFPAIEKAIGWFEQFIDGDGLLNNLPHWLFVDWSLVDKRGQSTVYNGLFVHTLEQCAELADIVGRLDRAQGWRTLASAIKAAINTHLWSEERGVYVDARVDGEQSRRISQHSNGVCLAYGIAPQERWQGIVAAISDPARVQITETGMGIFRGGELPAFDEERHIVLAQPFFMHHVHRGWLRAGRPDLVVENIRQRWGAMLAEGATTIWELWFGFASQCHGWSGTPTFDLSNIVLGVQPLSNGCERILIGPQPCGLSWAKGRFPTPHGDVAIDWRQTDNGLAIDVTAPEGVTPEVRLPDGKGVVTVNGQTVS